jgi:hypothetical protein
LRGEEKELIRYDKSSLEKREMRRRELKRRRLEKIGKGNEEQ